MSITVYGGMRRTTRLRRTEQSAAEAGHVTIWLRSPFSDHVVRKRIFFEKPDVVLADDAGDAGYEILRRVARDFPEVAFFVAV